MQSDAHRPFSFESQTTAQYDTLSVRLADLLSPVPIGPSVGSLFPSQVYPVSKASLPRADNGFRDPKLGFSFEYPKFWVKIPYMSVSGGTQAPTSASLSVTRPEALGGMRPPQLHRLGAVDAEG